MKSLRIEILIIFGLGFYFACANQAAPPGGPVDKTPPSVVHTVPDSNAIQVSRNTPIEFQFSESIDARSVQGAIFISPNPGDEVKIKVKGKKISLELADSLIADATYTVTLGTGIKDLRGNSMRRSHTVGFSTGAKLDRNQIFGRVFTDKVEEVTVWGYFLESGEVIDPGKTKPAYVTQCDAQGNFRLSNLAAREYRLFAVRDRNKNQLYDKGAEQVGVTSSDVDLVGTNLYAKDKFFQLMSEDTSLVRILSVDQPDQRHIRIRFSRPVYPGKEGQDILLSGVGSRRLSILEVFVEPEIPNTWTITTMPRDSASYQIILKNLKDSYGRSAIDSTGYEFISLSAPDKTSPRIMGAVPQDSSRLLFPHQTILFIFSEAMDTTRTDSLFEFMKDSTSIVSSMARWKTCDS